VKAQRNLRSGFTIVELLIASAITVAIVVMLGTMFGSLTKTTSRANQRTDAFRDARAALQMIERDLSGLVRTQRDAAGNPVTRPAAYLALKNVYVDPVATDPVTDNQQIYALIATKNSGPGDVCSVGYYCRWNPSKNSYSLHRFFADSTATYNQFTTAAVVTANFASDADLYTPAGSDDVLASYVYNFRVTPYDAAGNVISTYPYVCDPSAAANIPAPAAIEISFKAISTEAARTVVSVTSDPNDWMDETRSRYLLLIKPYAYEFRTRVKL
jgi:type II secretory pathway pseudopilin PulG